MNIEELKLVLSTVATVSDDAKSVAIWWFVANYGVSVLNNLFILIGLYVIVRVIARSFMGVSEWTRHGMACAKAWGGEGDEYSYNRDRQYINAIVKAAPEKAK